MSDTATSEENIELFKLLEEEQQRLTALIAHIKAGGGKAYDSAPSHVFHEKKCPPELEGKTSADFLAEYENLLEEVNEKLKKLGVFI